MSENGWGKGSVNNDIGWGAGAINNDIGWGDSHFKSWSGDTDIDGGTGIPVNTVAPVISGTTTLGSVLTTTNGTWTAKPAATFTYQWKRNGSNITGATNSTYTLVNDDGATNITCEVTATNDFGSANATSNTLAIPAFTDADAQAFITAASITNPTQQSAIEQLVTDLKGYGVWSKMKALYPFVGGTASSHKFNLKDPRDLDAAFRLVFNGGWTHSANGALPNGTNGFADTKLIPSNVMILNSSHISAYSRTQSATGYLFGCSNSGLTNRTLWQLGSTSYISLFTAPADYFLYNGANTRKLLLLNRTASNVSNAWENDIKKATSTNASTNRTTVPIYFGASNDNGTTTNYSNVQYAFASIGDGLTDTEAANFYTAVQTFQVTLGRSIGTQTVSDADAQAFVTNAGIVDQVEADAVNNLVIGLKADGVWSKIKALYPFVGGTASSHKFNLKNPLDTNAAFRLVFNGGWTHSSQGALPNGVNGWADTKLSPNIEMPFNQQIGYYLGTNAIGNKVDVGVYPEMNLWTKHASLGFILDFPTSADRATIINSDSRGNYFVFNNSTLGRGLYKGGSSIHSSTFLNKNLADNNTRFLRLSSDAFGFYFSDRELRFAALATGFTSLTEVTNFQTAMQVFNTTLNRQV